MPIIRKALRADAQYLATLAEQTFRDTFTAANRAEDMALHCSASYSECIQAQEIANPDQDTLVCEHKGLLVAFSQIRGGKPPACVAAARPTEIQRFYVSREWQGKGLAHDLMTACMDKARARGAEAVWLGVWERNPRDIVMMRQLSRQP